MSEMALTAGICKTATEEPAFIGKRENVGLGDMGQGVDHNYLYNKYIFFYVYLKDIFQMSIQIFIILKENVK